MCIQPPSSRSGTLVLTQVARLFTLSPLLRISASLRGGMHTRHLWAQTLPPSLSLPHTHTRGPTRIILFFFSPSLSVVVWHQPCCPDELVIVTETQETAGPHLPHSGTTVCTGVSLTCLTTCVILHWDLHYCCTCTLLLSTIFISGFLFFGRLWDFNSLNYWYTVSKDEPYKNTSWAIKIVPILPENVWLMLQHPEHRITGDEVGWVDRWSEISTAAGWP